MGREITFKEVASALQKLSQEDRAIIQQALPTLREKFGAVNAANDTIMGYKAGGAPATDVQQAYVVMAAKWDDYKGHIDSLSTNEDVRQAAYMAANLNPRHDENLTTLLSAKGEGKNWGSVVSEQNVLRGSLTK